MERSSAYRPSPTLVAAATAVVVATIAGPFQTWALPLPTRALFWAVLIGWQVGKWQVWPRLRPATIAELPWVAAGLLLLNALLPLELRVLVVALGRDIDFAFAPMFAQALLIGAGIAATIAAIAATLPRAGPALPPGPGPAEAPAAGAVADLAPERTGLAVRAGLPDLAAIDAVFAEDHYLRLCLADGRRPLVLHRFGDALADLAARDGEQVHRGAWVAARAVAGARRDGRRWWLRLADGSEIRVSDSRVAALRARGWLR